MKETEQMEALQQAALDFYNLVVRNREEAPTLPVVKKEFRELIETYRLWYVEEEQRCKIVA